jgi:sugar/nucleoside kinase (ribokinase family)
MTSHILCIGDVMLDVVTKIKVMPSAINYGSDTESDISTHGGGAAANVASWIACTGNLSTIVGHVGKDSAGAALQSEFDAFGVRHHNLAIAGAHSGVVVVLVDPTGERTMFPDNGANSGLTINDLPDLQGINAVYLSGYSPLDPASHFGVLEMVRKIKGAGLPIYFDPASVGGMKAIAKSEILDWLAHFDVLLLNEEEAEYLSGNSHIDEALDFLCNLVATVVIKLGASGAIAKNRDGRTEKVAAVTTVVVDKTGAGDAFAAGFISEFEKTRDLAASLVKASNVAAHCVAILGARPRVGTKI